MKLLGRQLIFGDPSPADMIIFDEVNSSYVRQVIDLKFSVHIFKTRPENLFIGPWVLFNFLFMLPSIKLSDIESLESGFIKRVLNQLKMIYFLACFKRINPKAIITMIDNGPDFHWLSKNCKIYPFIAIQNGLRLSYASKGTNSFFLQHYLCFGAHEKNLFKELNYSVENYYPVGSLLSSLHMINQKKVISKYDILIVSCWRGNIGFTQEVAETMRMMRTMDKLLAKYLLSRNHRAAIILRNEKGGEHWYIPELGLDEENYFKNIYGESAEIIETNFQKRNIYPIMQASELIFSLLSTALIEGLGMGKKSFFLNFSGSNEYHRDFDEAMVLTESQLDLFSQKIDDILAMPQGEYDKKYKSIKEYYMASSNEKTTHKIIKEKIEDIIQE